MECELSMLGFNIFFASIGLSILFATIVYNLDYLIKTIMGGRRKKKDDR